MRLTKSRDDVVLTGLLAGIGEYLNIDPTVVRIVFVVLFFAMTPFPVVPLYILGALIVPKAPREKDERRERPRPNPRRREGRRRRPRMDRDFEEFDDIKQASSKKANTIDEDDWSDF